MTKYVTVWRCFCSDCDWLKSEGRNPKFHSARKHARETGHTVIVSQIIEWSINMPLEVTE